MSDGPKLTFLGKLIVLLFVAGCGYGAYVMFAKKPLGSAPALAMVMILGSPSVTATRTATRSAVVALDASVFKAFRAAPATSLVRLRCR